MNMIYVYPIILLIQSYSSYPCYNADHLDEKVCFQHFNEKNCSEIEGCKFRRCCRSINQQSKDKCGGLFEQRPELCFSYNHKLQQQFNNVHQEYCIWDCNDYLWSKLSTGHYKSIHKANDKFVFNATVPDYQNDINHIMLRQVSPMGVAYITVQNYTIAIDSSNNTNSIHPIPHYHSRKLLGFDASKFKDIPRAHSGSAVGGGAAAITRPFSATGILKLTDTNGDVGECVGAVVHYLRTTTGPNHYNVFVLTAAHCCYDDDTSADNQLAEFYNIDSTSVTPTGSHIGTAGHVNFYYDPTYITRLNHDNSLPEYDEGAAWEVARRDWCIIHFDYVPQIAFQTHAAHTLQIKYDATRPRRLVMSTYRSPGQKPAGQNYRKKYMETAVHAITEYVGIYWIGHESTARGQSGSPFVHPDEIDMVRAVLSRSHEKHVPKSSAKKKIVMKDWVCAITANKYATIMTTINNVNGYGNAIPDAVSGTGRVMGTARAMVSDYGDKESVVLTDTDQLHGRSIGAISKMRYYNGYGYGYGQGYGLSINDYYSMNIVVFIMTLIIIIGMCCCIMMVMTIICGYFGVLTLKTNSNEKHGTDGAGDICYFL